MNPEEHLLGPLGKAPRGEVFFLWARLSTHSVSPDTTTALAAAEKRPAGRAQSPGEHSGAVTKSALTLWTSSCRDHWSPNSPLALLEAMG